VRARAASTRPAPIDVAAIAAIGQHAGHRTFRQFRRGEPGQHLEIGQLLRDLGTGGEKTDAQAGRQRFEKPPR